MSNINEVYIEDELTSSYLSYAMSVIVGRALPDVRDGLKPVHRRILFVMRELNNTFDKGYKKSARIVGDVIGKYHPHGEIAVYDSIVRLSQTFVQRYALIDGQGNFGSVDGDSPAAMRYTEIRMSELSEFLLKDLEYSVVDFVDNYDGTEKQPSVLPSMIPNILINGSCGIAVGMATNIPPHNLGEVIDACVMLLEDYNVSVDGLMKVVTAPDFPTCGVIYGADELSLIYKTGKGKFFLRAHAYFDFSDSGVVNIIIDELPYQVNKSNLVESIVNLVNIGELCGVRSVRDDSDKDGLRICIEILKSADPNVILNKLFLNTKMQISYNVNMVVLVNNVPKLLNLKNILRCFLDHRKEIVYRRTQYKLIKAENKLHLLEGLCVAILNFDKVLSILISSSDFFDIKSALCNNAWNLHYFFEFLKEFNLDKFNYNVYQFSDLQIQAILDMRVSRLTKLEKNKLFQEYKNLLIDISYYNNIINDTYVLDSIIKDELFFIKKKFGDVRRTKIVLKANDINVTDLVIRKNIIVTLSYYGYIKFQLLDNYNIQRRRGRGKSSLFIKDNDFISSFLICDTHDILLCFSTFGKVYWIDLYMFPLSSRKSKGISILTLLNLKQDERISFILPVKSYEKNRYVLMATKNGIVKRILLTDLKNQRTNGIIVISLMKDDFLVSIKLVKNLDDIMIFSEFGRALRFPVKNIRCTSRTSKGVFGMKLSLNDKVISVIVFDENSFLLTATRNGYGKLTKMSEFLSMRRGLKGIIGMRIDKKNGFLVDVEKVSKDDDLLLITNGGIISRIKANDVPCTSRNTKGVFLINLIDNEKLFSIKSINKEFL